jgi:hypothetical protein
MRVLLFMHQTISLGVYPDVSLNDARAKHAEVDFPRFCRHLALFALYLFKRHHKQMIISKLTFNYKNSL